VTVNRLLFKCNLPSTARDVNFLISRPVTPNSNAIATSAVTVPTAMAVYEATVIDKHTVPVQKELEETFDQNKRSTSK